MAIAPDDNADYDPRVTTQTSTQASQPTSASKWDQAAVQSNTPYTPDGIDPQLAELLKSLEAPPPTPLTRTQKIGAGLMRLGNGLAGRDPSIQSGPEQDYARQAQAASESQMATKRGLIGEAVRQSGEARRDTAIAERQRLDDERAAKQKEADRTLARGSFPRTANTKRTRQTGSSAENPRLT